MATENNERIDKSSEPFLAGYNDYFVLGEKSSKAEVESAYIRRNYLAGWAAAEADDKRYGRPHRYDRQAIGWFIFGLFFLAIFLFIQWLLRYV